MGSLFQKGSGLVFNVYPYESSININSKYISFFSYMIIQSKSTGIHAIAFGLNLTTVPQFH